MRKHMATGKSQQTPKKKSLIAKWQDSMSVKGQVLRYSFGCFLIQFSVPKKSMCSSTYFSSGAPQKNENSPISAMISGIIFFKMGKFKKQENDQKAFLNTYFIS